MKDTNIYKNTNIKIIFYIFLLQLTMFSVFKGTSNITCNSNISNSSISNTNIDMNGKVIINSGLPTNSTDLTNKYYVDAHISQGFVSTIVTLSGTSYNTVISDTVGSLSVNIKSTNTDGPSATFNISKSNPSRYPSYSRTTSSPGYISHERLELIWDPGLPLKMKKTGTNYDGNYKVIITTTI